MHPKEIYTQGISSTRERKGGGKGGVMQFQ